MGILGSVLGSFGCCQARRLRAKETKKPIKSKWSVCEHCGKELCFYENIPIFSWLLLKGKCKKCGRKIGVAEILAEILMAAAFLAIGWKFWPELRDAASMVDLGLAGGKMVMLIILATLYCILFVYDAIWKVMPASVLWGSVVVAGGYFGLTIFGGIDILSFLAAIGVLPGVYFLLYFLSGEKLVGGGDWILALSLALVLGNFWLAFLTLFLANFLATITYLPSLMRKEKNKQIAFGPFLILAGMIVFLLQDTILELIAF